MTVTVPAGHDHHSTVVPWVEAAEAELYERLSPPPPSPRLPGGDEVLQRPESDGPAATL